MSIQAAIQASSIAKRAVGSCSRRSHRCFKGGEICAVMIRLSILLAFCLVSVEVVSQSIFPWNPDYDDDGQIAQADLLGFLSSYGNSTFVETCAQGAVCDCDVIDHNDPWGKTWYPPESCGFIITRKVGSHWHRRTIRLSPNADSLDVVTIYMGGNYSSYGGPISYETLIDGEWVVLQSWAYEAGNSHRYHRFIFNGSHWEEIDFNSMIVPYVID